MTNNSDSTSIQTSIELLKLQENSLCFVLTGISGLGKSILCSHMIGATRAERLSENDPTIRPLKYITVQDETPTRELADTLLEVLGHPSPRGDSAPDRGTQMALCPDRFHSSITDIDDRTIFSEWLKALIARTLVPRHIEFGTDELEAPTDRDLGAGS